MHFRYTRYTNLFLVLCMLILLRFYIKKLNIFKLYIKIIKVYVKNIKNVCCVPSFEFTYTEGTQGTQLAIK